MLTVLLLAGLASALDSSLYRDSTVLAALLLLLGLFYRLMASFPCTRLARTLTLFGAVAIVFAQLLNTTEEIAAFAGMPILSRESFWNAFLDGFLGKTGIISVFAALVLAVIELNTAHNVLERKSARLATEIEERVEAQQALARHRDHLEDLVAERTAALEESQRARLAQERVAMLGQIMAAVSHEMRNPLGTVRSSLYTIKTGRERGDETRISRAIERAERNVSRCDRIIEELLDLSRARDIAPRDTPLDTWLTSVLKSAGIPETVGCDTDLQAGLSIAMDRGKMRRAVLNLINNSVQSFEDATDREHRLMITSIRDGERCRICISDTGPGMSKEILGNLGRPLFSTRAFGVGLGLPVVEETIRGHGGEVRYESEVGKGTRVTIDLPLSVS